MQLTIPDCCLGEICPGLHVEGHHKKEDGTYYSTDDHKSNAYHYHNTDGSVFYRYPDGSEYYRRKNGNITFRPPGDPPKKPEEGDPAVAPTPLAEDRPWRPWYEWPPQLNISVKTHGSSVIIRDASGSTVTFEPVGPDVGVDPVPLCNGSTSSGHVQFDEGPSQASRSATFGVGEWARRETLVDSITSRGQD